MNRSAFMIDLLRPDLTTEDTFRSLCNKYGMTTEDLDQIVRACRKVTLATAQARKVIEAR